MRLDQGGHRSHPLSGEDLPPPIGVRGGDPSMAAEALAGRDAAIHWSSREAAYNKLGRGRLLFVRLRVGPCHLASVLSCPEP